MCDVHAVVPPRRPPLKQCMCLSLLRFRPHPSSLTPPRQSAHKTVAVVAFKWSDRLDQMCATDVAMDDDK